MPAQACLSDLLLERILADELTEQELEIAEEHLGECAGCQARLDEIANDDAMPIRNLNKPKAYDEPALWDAIDAMRDETQVVEEKPDLSFLEPSDNPAHLGKLDRYEVTGILGRGGFGIVMKANDTALLRVVAIKTLAPALASNPSARKRFVREAQAAAAVAHEHVVAIHAIEESAGIPYLVMPYIAGISLQERIDRDGPLEIAEILRIGMQAASGLAAAHAQGLIHRDIKPANILLENGVQRVKITDFGLARAVDDASLTQSGVLAGTPLYMAPEQAKGEPLDHRADLFSMGSVLYACCTGRAPFRASTAMAILKRVCEAEPRPIRDVRPEVPEFLAAIVMQLLSKDPNDRPATAAEVAKRFEARLAELQSPKAADAAPTASSPATATRRRRLHPAEWAALIVTPLIVIGGLGASKSGAMQQVKEFVQTVLRIRTREGTLIVKLDDPNVKVRVDGATDEVVIEGTGLREFRLKPGKHQVTATKDGAEVFTDEVTISRGEKTIVRIGAEPLPGPGPGYTDTTLPDGRKARVLANGSMYVNGQEQPRPAQAEGEPKPATERVIGAPGVVVDLTSKLAEIAEAKEKVETARRELESLKSKPADVSAARALSSKKAEVQRLLTEYCILRCRFSPNAETQALGEKLALASRRLASNQRALRDESDPSLTELWDRRRHLMEESERRLLAEAKGAPGGIPPISASKPPGFKEITVDTGIAGPKIERAKLIKTVKIPRPAEASMMFISPDTTRSFTISETKTRSWTICDLETGSLIVSGGAVDGALDEEAWTSAGFSFDSALLYLLHHETNQLIVRQVKDGRTVWSRILEPLDQPVFGRPIRFGQSGRSIYVKDEGGILKLDSKTGADQARFDLGAAPGLFDVAPDEQSILVYLASHAAGEPRAPRSGGVNGRWLIFDTATGKTRQVMEDRSNQGAFAGFMPDGRRLLMRDDNAWFIRHIEEGKNSVQLSTLLPLVPVASNQGLIAVRAPVQPTDPIIIHILSDKNAAVLQSITLHAMFDRISMRFKPDGKTLVVLTPDGVVTHWDVSEALKKLTEGEKPLDPLLDASGRAASPTKPNPPEQTPKTVRIDGKASNGQDLVTPRLIKSWRLAIPAAPGQEMVFAADAQRFAYVSGESELIVADADPEKGPKKLGSLKSTTTLALDSQGERIMVVEGKLVETLSVRDVDSGKVRFSKALEQYTEDETRVFRFVNDRVYLSSEGGIDVLDATTGALKTHFEILPTPTDFDVSSDGGKLVCLAYDIKKITPYAFMFDTETHKSERLSDDLSLNAQSIRFEAGGKRVKCQVGSTMRVLETDKPCESFVHVSGFFTSSLAGSHAYVVVQGLPAKPTIWIYPAVWPPQICPIDLPGIAEMNALRFLSENRMLTIDSGQNVSLWDIGPKPENGKGERR